MIFLNSHIERVKILYQVREMSCLLYTSDAADERSSVDLGGRRIIKKQKKIKKKTHTQHTDSDTLIQNYAHIQNKTNYGVRITNTDDNDEQSTRHEEVKTTPT